MKYSAPEQVRRARAKLAREEARADASSVFSLACKGLSQDAVGSALGIGRSGVQRLQSIDDNRHLTLADLRLLSASGFGEIASRCASWALEPLETDAGGSVLKLAGEASKETADVNATLLQRAGDGFWCPEDADATIAEIDEAMQALGRLRARMVAVKAKRGEKVA